jgi:hypothetical protein
LSHSHSTRPASELEECDPVSNLWTCVSRYEAGRSLHAETEILRNDVTENLGWFWCGKNEAERCNRSPWSQMLRIPRVLRSRLSKQYA